MTLCGLKLLKNLLVHCQLDFMGLRLGLVSFMLEEVLRLTDHVRMPIFRVTAEGFQTSTEFFLFEMCICLIDLVKPCILECYLMLEVSTMVLGLETCFWLKKFLTKRHWSRLGVEMGNHHLVSPNICKMCNELQRCP